MLAFNNYYVSCANIVLEPRAYHVIDKLLTCRPILSVKSCGHLNEVSY